MKRSKDSVHHVSPSGLWKRLWFRISSVDLKKLPADIASCEWTRERLNQLPDDVDPCGENGEIHTVVVDGPMFRDAISVEIGEVIQRDGFAFADIIPIK